MCDTMLVELDVQRTFTGAEICALYQAIGRISSLAVTYTKTFFGVVQATGSGEATCVGPKHNDADWWKLL